MPSSACLTNPVQWLLVDSISKQFNAFSKGFFSVCGGPALEMFKPQELELLICGSPTLDFHALEEVAILEDGWQKRLKLLFLQRHAIAGITKDIQPFACCGRLCIRSTWSRRRSSFSFAPAATARLSKGWALWCSLYREMVRTVSAFRQGGRLSDVASSSCFLFCTFFLHEGDVHTPAATHASTTCFCPSMHLCLGCGREYPQTLCP